MNIQKLIIAALTATVLPTSLNAQQTFNEMMSVSYTHLTLPTNSRV